MVNVIEPQTQSTKSNNKTFVVYDFENDKLYCVESSVDLYDPNFYREHQVDWLQKVQELISKQDSQDQNQEQNQQDASQQKQEQPQQSQQQQEPQNQQPQSQNQSQDQNQAPSPILTEDLLSKLLNALLQPVCLFGICLPLGAWLLIGFLAGKVIKKVLG